MVNPDRHGSVFVLTLGDDENRFHPERLAAISAALDEVEAAEGAKAVVTTGVGKFYSNGLDLDFMSTHPDDAEPGARRHQVTALRRAPGGRPLSVVGGAAVEQRCPGGRGGSCFASR